MWEKCGTYSHNKGAAGAVRHVLPQAGGVGGGGDTIGGGGSANPEPGSYIYIYIYICTYIIPGNMSLLCVNSMSPL